MYQSPIQMKLKNKADSEIQRKIRTSKVENKWSKNVSAMITKFLGRINNFNPSGITYSIDASNNLIYSVKDKTKLTSFDQDMINFMDSSATIPFRFVNQTRTFVDSYYHATVDLDDLLGGSDISMQLNLLHILVERAANKNYEKRRRVSAARFIRDHRKGIKREERHLQEVLQDPSITYRREIAERNGVRFVFRSTNKYRVVHWLRMRGGHVKSDVNIHQKGKAIQTLSAFLASRKTGS